MDGNVPSVNIDSEEMIKLISDGAIAMSGGFSTDGAGDPGIIVDKNGELLATIVNIDLP